MYIVNSKEKQNKELINLEISEDYLRYVIESIAIPRHYIHERSNNQKVRDWIDTEFKRMGLKSSFQSEYDNVVATLGTIDTSDSVVIIGGHYDSVPNSFGADDNASAIAGVLAVAQELQRNPQSTAFIFVAFNREEDNLLGSKEFVLSLSNEIKNKIKAVHILEMIGYCSHQANSQFIPKGLPIKISNVGNFIAIIANRSSNHLVKPIVKLSEKHIENLPVKGLKVFLGAENHFTHLLRSDHAPFWQERLPALMWTDTSEFRNSNYHQPTDTPDTLDYSFMKKVVELLVLVVMDEENRKLV